MPEPLILWFRRDLRLGDNPMLAAAVASGRPLVPVFLCDAGVEALGAAAKWRLGLALAAFARRLEAAGARLILRRGEAATVMPSLIAETGAAGVWWARGYEAAAIARDTALKCALRAAGREVRSFPGHLLHEPFAVETGQGGPYRVFSPFWTAIRGRDPGAPAAEPARLAAPDTWPASDRLEDWALGAAMRRGAAVVAAHIRPGEPAARARLAAFLDGPVVRYAEDRDRLDRDATSGLSDWLAWGEIGIRDVWHAARRAMEEGSPGAPSFLRELGWREFAWHLLYHFPAMDRANWRADWDAFPWRGDSAEAERWRRGLTGEPVVDAAMREMYVTGRMHNRARMIAASYLTKHLLTDWRIGLRWFADCLTDWDPAANAMGWQWVAGSGPDASPYFRVFNPAGQAEKFDADGAYRRRFVAELSAEPGSEAAGYFDAVPRSWGMDPRAPYPAPVVDLAEGRARALAAYDARKA